MNVTLYHNPRCSKSRQALALLQQQGIAPTVIKYLETPPDAATLKRILSSLDLPARALLRKGERAYREAGLDDAALSEDELIAAMVAQPILIERPIAVCQGRAAIGRPPEKVLAIL